MSSSLTKEVARATAAFEACRSIPTEALEKIAGLPVAERLAALAEAVAPGEESSILNRLATRGFSPCECEVQIMT